MTTSLLEQIRTLVGNDNFIGKQALSLRDCGYWRSDPLTAKVLLTPTSTDQVSAVLRLCHKAKQPIVILGGMTGAVAGQYPTVNDIALSTEKLNGIIDIDTTSNTLTVGSGCTLQQVQEYAAANQRLFALDIGARGSCTIGGNIATNAGGMEVIRYGMMREQVLGLEVVLANGTVLSSLNKMQKNNAGYDLKQLFMGSEGTLGLVTKAVLRLRPQTLSQETVLVTCNTFSQVLALLTSAQQALGSLLTRFELMDKAYFEAQTTLGRHHQPFDELAPWSALIELRGCHPQQDRQQLENWLQELFTTETCSNAVLASHQQQHQKLWAIRESFDAIISNKVFFNYDVSLPITEMSAYISNLKKSVIQHWPQGQCFCFGHIGDGNLHFFIFPNQGDKSLKAEADSLVYTPLAALGGSISAEHGIGLDKKQWLHLSRSSDEIATMALLKGLFDPHGILNNSRVVDASYKP